jgi:hypothetical protein
MPVAQQGVSGSEQENECKNMPFQLLGYDKTFIEQISHYHIDKHHDDQSQGRPGNSLADLFIHLIDPICNSLQQIHINCLLL